jgi:hypothetical protein
MPAASTGQDRHAEHWTGRKTSLAECETGTELELRPTVSLDISTEFSTGAIRLRSRIDSMAEILRRPCLLAKVPPIAPYWF